MLDVSSLSLIGLLLSADTEKDSGFCSLEGQLLLGYILVMFLLYSFVLSILVKLWLKSKPLGAGEMAQWVYCFCASVRTCVDSHPDKSHSQQYVHDSTPILGAGGRRSQGLVG